MKRFLVTRNTLDQRVTYFGMNFTAGCGQAAMKDPMMQLALLQVRTIRRVIMFNWITIPMIEMARSLPISFCTPHCPTTLPFQADRPASRRTKPKQLYFRVIPGNTWLNRAVQTFTGATSVLWPLSSVSLVFTHSIERGGELRRNYTIFTHSETSFITMVNTMPDIPPQSGL